MFKLATVLLKGAAARSEEALADRRALFVLDRQMRAAAAALDAAKRALALAIARDGQEGKRLDSVLPRIADLEARARSARRRTRGSCGRGRRGDRGERLLMDIERSAA